MQKIFWLYIAIIFVGMAFLFIPEGNDRLIVINEYHGPSMLDATGLLLIIFCWAIMLVYSIKQAKKIRNAITAKWLMICTASILGGSIWIVASLLQNSQYGWLPGTFLAVAGYTALFSAAYKR